MAFNGEPFVFVIRFSKKKINIWIYRPIYRFSAFKDRVIGASLLETHMKIFLMKSEISVPPL